MLNEEAIKELDRDVAEQYFVMNDMEVPKPAVEPYKIVTAAPNENPLENKENINQEARKSVRFKVPADIDDDEDW